MGFVPLQPKFLRALQLAPFTSPGGDATLPLIFKIIYEFWGFCINGGNSLVQPGGFANSQVTGSYLSQATGFESGSTVLLASGSDGQTVLQTVIFTATGSNPFAPSVLGKYLVCWQSGSTSTDDSIYRIVQWFGSSSIGLDPTSGGTSFGPSGSVPALTSRSGINYRVVDFAAAAHLAGYANGQYMVMQFNGAGNVNPGQRNSQAKLVYRDTGGVVGAGFNCLNVLMSPSGSWDGTHFLGETVQEITADGTRDQQTGHGSTWVNYLNQNGQTGMVTLIADNTFIHVFAGGPWCYSGYATGGSDILTIEIPQRLYPQANDPNLICAMNMGNTGGVVGGDAVGWGCAMRWFPSPYDSLTRRWPVAVRCHAGSYWNGTVWGNTMNGSITNWSWMFNPVISKFLMSDGILCQTSQVLNQTSAAGQFSLARARIRSSRYCTGAYQKLMRIGDNNDRWIHAGVGLIWPWDHAILPLDPFPSM